MDLDTSDEIHLQFLQFIDCYIPFYDSFIL